MDSYPVLCNYIALPSSKIQSPGSLLKNIENQNRHEAQKHQIHKLLKQFKEIVEAHNDKNYQELRLSHCRKESEDCPSSSSDGHSQNTGLSNVIKTLEVQLSSQMVENLTKKASQILAFYGIELSIQIKERYLDEMFNLLNTLIQELCVFPQDFIKKLRLKKFVICASKDLIFWKIKYPSDSATILCLDLDIIETQTHVSHQLFKTLLGNVLLLKPQILIEWRDAIVEDNDTERVNIYEELEVAWVALMKSVSNGFFRSKVEKLKEILIKNFPAELSDEWKQTVQTRKKLRKVTFDLSNLSTGDQT